MAATTIIVDQQNYSAWRGALNLFDRETSKRQNLDLVGLGIPNPVFKETLLEVLNLMQQPAGGVALICTHATPFGMLMRITDRSNSSESKFLLGICQVLEAQDEFSKLKDYHMRLCLLSQQVNLPFTRQQIEGVPGAITLFKKLWVTLSQIDQELAGRLVDPSPDTFNLLAEAETWFDKWLDLMAKACLGRGLSIADLNPVLEALRRIRNAHLLQRVEIRGCNIGNDPYNLNVLKKFFGVRLIVASRVIVFCGRLGVNLNPSGNLDQLAVQLGGFRGNNFTAPDKRDHRLNTVLRGEPDVALGRRNRIFPVNGTVKAIIQFTRVGTFEFKGRLWSTTAATVSQFLNITIPAGVKDIPVWGMWTAGSNSGTLLPFVFPFEEIYRDFLGTST